jgi:hypothetical protein
MAWQTSVRGKDLSPGGLPMDEPAVEVGAQTGRRGGQFSGDTV